MNKVVIGLITGALALLIGYGVGRYVQPAQVVTKTQVVTVEHTHTVTITEPNGTTTITTDTGIVTKEKDKTAVTDNKPQWKVSGLAAVNPNTVGMVYGAQVERRILGPIYVGAFGLTNSTFGINLGIEF